MTKSKVRSIIIVILVIFIIIILIYINPLISIFVFIAVLIVAAVVSETRKVNQFKHEIRVEKDKLVLPEEALVELGTISLKSYYRTYKSGRRSIKEWVNEVAVLESKEITTKAIDLDQICAKPFFLLADPDDIIILEAPGFKVSSGRFKDIVVACLNQLYIPERVIELEVGDPNEHAKAKVKLSPKGFETEATWVFKAPTQKKVIYDKKHGVYRIVDEYTTKPQAKRARVEICAQTPTSKLCTPLVKLDVPNKPIQGVIPFKINDKLLVFYTKIMGGHYYFRIKNALETHHKTIIVGYKPNHLTARIILEIPQGKDLVAELPL